MSYNIILSYAVRDMQVTGTAHPQMKEIMQRHEPYEAGILKRIAEGLSAV